MIFLLSSSSFLIFSLSVKPLGQDLVAVSYNDVGQSGLAYG